MAFFDADLPVNNSKLPELEILGKKVEINEKKGILYLSRDNITIELTGIFKEKADGSTKGTVTALVCKTGDDEPTWDISGIRYDFDKLFIDIGEGNLDKVIEKFFKKKDTVWGSHFDDKLFGMTGDDEVEGWRGDDELNGGPGRDKLKGGIGDDIFVYDQKLNKYHFDVLEDFKAVHDVIHLSRSIFTEFEKGKLDPDQLVIGKKPVGDIAQLIYREGNGLLYYDSDGTGPADKVKFFNIGENRHIDHDNFFVV
jgi:Ca2+-binding RTX toxin-like protein